MPYYVDLPRTRGSSSYRKGLMCLFSITSTLVIIIIVLNKAHDLLVYLILSNKQHIHKTCSASITALKDGSNLDFPVA